MKTDIKVIIFDIGSVCTDADWLKINEEMMKKFKISTLVRSSGSPELNKLYDETMTGKRDILDYFEKIADGKHDAKEVADFYKESYKRNRIVNKELLKKIEKLKKRFIIACLTDTQRIHFEAHEEQGILNSFAHKFASHQIGGVKTDKNTFLKVLKHLDIKPKEAIFIDDREKNIKNAKELGIKTILFKNNKQLITDLHKLGIKV